MQELLDWLEYIEDNRQQRKVRHALKDILVIVLFATLANADDWVEIALFAESYQDYLRKYIELKNGIPSHDTIRRVMGMVSPEILQQLYGKWQDRLNRNEGELLKKIICIDGKTMRSNKKGNEKASHINLHKMCMEQGFQVSQPEISKLFSGKLQLTLYQLTAFSEVLKLAPDYLLTGRERFHGFSLDDSAFVLNPFDDAFGGYLGSYNTVFFSTSPYEEKLMHGNLSFRPSDDGDICEAEFILDTGETDGKKHSLKKKYKGQLIISRRLGVAYCILVNNKMGEFSVIEFRHRSFLIRQAECRLGLVLTTASGETKVPIVHKIFLSRRELDGFTISKVSEFLKMEAGEMIISRSSLKILAENMPYNLKAVMESAETEEYVVLDEMSIRKKNKKLSRREMAEIICKIKEKSIGDFTVRLTENDDEKVFELMRDA